MPRKLVAPLVCRVNSTRLYGKPLQRLCVEDGLSILDHIIQLLQMQTVIDELVLGVSDDIGNELFHQTAQKHGLTSISGGEDDVLGRSLKAVEAADGTDAFNITTESPFIYYQMIERAWEVHCVNNNDVTGVDTLPDGSGFSIFSVEAWKIACREGEQRHRGDTSSYIRENMSRFKVETLEAPAVVQRRDIRLTVDYPEDLILCRRVYERFKGFAPLIPLDDIITYIDSESDLQRLVAPYVLDPKLY
jgi:spore coat polysaccharide biosynthesis protein SpsF